MSAVLNAKPVSGAWSFRHDAALKTNTAALCDQLLATFDGSTEKAYRLTIVPLEQEPKSGALYNNCHPSLLVGRRCCSRSMSMPAKAASMTANGVLHLDY